MAVVLVALAAFLLWKAWHSTLEAGSSPDDSRGEVVASAPEPGSDIHAGSVESQPLPIAVKGSGLPGDADEVTGDVEKVVSIAGPIIGTIVDVDGSPVGGARVQWIPSRRTIETAGEGDWEEMPDAVPQLDAVTTRGDGRFSISGPHEPSLALQVEEGLDEHPVLLVSAEGLATQAFTCLGFNGEALDMGSLVMPPGAALRGRVVDESGRAFAGVLVRAWPSRWPTGMWPPPGSGDLARLMARFASLRTKGDGTFAFSGLMAADVSLEVRSLGFVTARPSVALVADTPRDLGDVVLERAGSVSGVVLDREGSPVAGAEIFMISFREGMARQFEASDDPLAGEIPYLKRAGRERLAVTDEEGRFLVSGLLDANYWVHVFADGYEWGRASGVRPGPRDVQIELSRQAHAVLEFVDAETGAPVVGAQVRAWRRRSPDGRPSRHDMELTVRGDTGALERVGLVEDSVGGFVVERVGPARTDVQVVAEGYGGRGFQLPGQLAATLTRHTLKLTPESRVAGRVVDRDGMPVPGAQVTCRGPPTARVPLPEAETTADEEGRFEVRGLQPAEWQVVATAPGFAPAWVGVWVPPRDDPDIPVERREALLQLELRLPRAGAVFGTTVEKGGERQPRRAVYLQYMEEAAVPEGLREFTRRNTVSDVSGQFRVEDLIPGSWWIEDLVVDVPEGGEVELVVGGLPQTRVRVLGQVLDGSGPVAGARVEATFRPQSSGNSIWRQATSVITEGDGRFEVQVERGCRLRLLARGPEPGSGHSPILELELQDGEEVVRDLMLAGGRVEGRVTSRADGAPVPGALVVLQEMPAEGSMPLTLNARGPDGDLIWFWPRTDADGRFVLHRVAAGSHRLVVDHDDYLPSLIDPIHVGPDAVVQGIEVTLESPCRVEITVIDDAGLPVLDGTRVTLDPEVPYSRPGFMKLGGANSPLRSLSTGNAGWPLQSWTRAGRCSFGGLRSGSWTASVKRHVKQDGDWLWEELGRVRVDLLPGQVGEVTLHVQL